jgi:hypothetical protein
MRSTKFVKLLRECGIIGDFSSSKSTRNSQLSSADAELIHAKLCRKLRYSQGFDFETFLKALEFIAKRVYPEVELDSSYLQLIEGFVLKLENEWNSTRAAGSSGIQAILEQFREPEVGAAECDAPVSPLLLQLLRRHAWPDELPWVPQVRLRLHDLPRAAA